MMRLTLGLLLNACILCVAEAQESVQPSRSTQSEGGVQKVDLLPDMKAAASGYAVYRGDDRTDKLVLVVDPVLRFNDPITKVPDGALFIWTAAGTPAAMLCVWYHRTGAVFHEFQSLSRGRLEVSVGDEIRWRPIAPGAEYKTLDKDLSVAEKPARRLSQMRRLIRGFSASVSDSRYGRQQLRLMPQPIFRFGRRGSDVLDGALFSFAKGTNPEVIVSIEARRNETGDYAWQYAPARMTSRECELRWRDKIAWTVPFDRSNLPQATYFNFVIRSNP